MKTIFFDVDTQNDFMNRDGRLYVPDAESIKPNLAQLTKYACQNRIPIFGDVDCHFGTEEYKEREAELAKWGGHFPDHCMNGTVGQRKIKETTHIYYPPRENNEIIIGNSYFVRTAFINNPLANQKPVLGVSFLGRATEVDLCDETLERIIKKYVEDSTYSFPEPNEGLFHKITSGIFFEKQSYDVATNPYFGKVMDAIRPERVIVYGVATDYCIRAAVKGLVQYAKEVYAVTDAVKGITPQGVEETIKEFQKLGVQFITTKEILEGRSQ